MNTLWTPDVFKIHTLLDGKIRLVGGCVRDYLRGVKTNDIDIATTLLPHQVAEKLTNANIKIIQTGAQYGTIVAHINSNNYDITTLRRDVQTDGRHAIVEFTRLYKTDAMRRDFTINALYMDHTGRIYDYTNGINDLHNGHIQFIGDADTRIREDYLRIWRYFRFWSLISTNTINPQILKICIQNRTGLEKLSVERRRDELLKLLMTPRVIEALNTMAQNGLLDGLLPTPQMNRLEKLLDKNPTANVWQRLGAVTDLKTLMNLRLSKKDLQIIQQSPIN